jgi:hypothetical protein
MSGPLAYHKGSFAVVCVSGSFGVERWSSVDGVCSRTCDLTRLWDILSLVSQGAC